MITDLQHAIKPYLIRARSFYLATALINRGGYNILKNNLPTDCKSQYLIGINLPSCPDVLQDLYSESNEESKVRIYNAGKTYHPKVYIIRTEDDCLYAFVGSANTTTGGLSNNVEMSAKIEDQQICSQLLAWFTNIFDQSGEMNQPFLDTYRKSHQGVKRREASNRSDLTKAATLLTAPATVNSPSSIIVAGSQYFGQVYFDAYQKQNWVDYSEAANERRKAVKERFKRLHWEIYERFEDYGMDELYCHYLGQHIISSHRYVRGYTRSELKSMWLHYGYPKEKISGEKPSFLNHPRMQIILEPESIGIWLVVGKDGGAIAERKAFKHRMQHDAVFRELTFQQFKALGGSYWIFVADDDAYVSDINSADEFNEYIQEDDYGKYFIIGRTLNPSDDLLSESNINDTVLLEFQRLYPLFNSISI